ncbi:MAG: helix-turn-helix transcriptional regulator [Candidatus Gastranaerophilales bacterium]
MQNKKLIGAKIKQIRKQNKMTQELFSEKIGIESVSLSNIENGKSFPSMQTILKIFEEFDILPNDFFDVEYLKSSIEIENDLIDIIKSSSDDKKKILYKIIKSFV